MKRTSTHLNEIGFEEHWHIFPEVFEAHLNFERCLILRESSEAYENNLPVCNMKVISNIELY